MYDLFRQYNEIEAIYGNKNLIEYDDGTFECPVCNKTYAKGRRSFAQAHMDKRDCYSPVDVFSNTKREQVAYDLFKSIKASENASSYVSIKMFRKSRIYKAVIIYTLFCDQNEVKNRELYYAWIRDVKNFSHANGILSHAIKESTLREYRVWLYNNPIYIDSDRYFNQNPEILDPKYDLSFHTWFIRDLEKAKFSLIAYLEVTNQSLKAVGKRLGMIDRVRLYDHAALISVLADEAKAKVKYSDYQSIAIQTIMED